MRPHRLIEKAPSGQEEVDRLAFLVQRAVPIFVVCR